MKSIKKFLILIGVLLATQGAWAQIQIHVQVLPPYQSRIGEYASRPDLMLLSLSNTTLQTQEVQLTGSLVGDNGISAWVRPGFRSPSPIRIEPGSVVNLNGHDFAFLFDPNHLEYAGISRTDINRGVGLLEGTYELCIQALDYDLHTPLSPDKPLGCTIFTISSAEPPRVLTPMDQQVMDPMTQTVFPITWSTSPGSSPLTEYKVKMVELVEGQDPNDALRSEYLPVFYEETVTTNSVLYGPAHPPLTPGRSYAVMVQAIDPFQSITFRNNGQSEVIQFLYGESTTQGASTTRGRELPSKRDQDKKYATNTLTGRLVWAFKNGEESYHAGASTPQESAVPTENDGGSTAPSWKTFYYNESPLQLAAIQLLAQRDPTLAPDQPELSITSVSTSQFATSMTASTITHTAVQTSNTPGNNRYPLAGATVMLRGYVRSDYESGGRNPGVPLIDGREGRPSGSDRGVSGFTQTSSRSNIGNSRTAQILASGTTDEDGHYTLSFLHPEYEGMMPYERLVLSVNQEGFEPFEEEVSLASLRSRHAVNLGTHVMLARSFRLALEITGENESTDALLESDLTISLYRSADRAWAESYWQHEGGRPIGDRANITLDGATYELVSSQTFSGETANNGEFLAYAAGALFYGDDLYVHVQTASQVFEDQLHQLHITDPLTPGQYTLEVHTAYEMKMIEPQVAGEVLLAAEQLHHPVEGAMLQILFEADDVLYDPYYTSSHYATDGLSRSPGLFQTTLPGRLPEINPRDTRPVRSPTIMGHHQDDRPGFRPLAGGDRLNEGISLTGAAGRGFQEVSVVDPADEVSTPAFTSRYTAVTDSNGRYFFNGLPVLRDGATYTVQLVHVPEPNQSNAVRPAEKQFSFQAEKGKISSHTFYVETVSTRIRGRLVDEDNQPVPMAQLRFKNSQNIFETDANGRFETTHIIGDHILMAEKFGFLRQEFALEIKDMRRSAVQQVGDLGPMKQRTGRIRFEVIDQHTQVPIPDIHIQLFDTTHVTDNLGLWEYVGVGGRTLVRFTPSPGMPYVAMEKQIDITEDAEIKTVRIPMERGVRVHGTIMSDGSPVAAANISLEDTKLHQAQSNESGQYEIYLPAGEQNIRAAKTGHISKVENTVLPDQGDVNLDFDLQSGQGRNISQLLGFDIELDKAEDDGDGQKWTGKFVGLRPAGELFGQHKTYELTFTNVSVTFDADGNAIPANNEVVTNEKHVKLEVFRYLPVLLNDLAGSSSPIKVRLNQLGFGTVRGKLNLDYGALINKPRFKFKEADSLFIGIQDTLAMADQGLEIFRADDASILTEIALRFLTAQGDSAELELYGFKAGIDLKKSRITQSGIELSGSLSSPQLGPVKPAIFRIQSLKFGSRLDLEELIIDTLSLPTLEIGGIGAELHGIRFDENGFSLDGKFNLEPLSSKLSEVAFSKLRMTKELLFGGVLKLPLTGIDVHSIATFTAGDTPLGFGRVGNTDIYQLSGSGSIQFKKLFTKKITLQSFAFQSDGKFQLTVPVNREASLAFASYSIKDVTFDYTSSSPQLTIDGGLKLELPMVTVEASKINFRATSTGNVSFNLDTIAGRVQAPILDLGIKVAVLENGLAGEGSLSIPGTPVNAEVAFHYNRPDSGLNVGASFKVGTHILIGAATISELGGGFTYSASNKKFSATISGSVSVTGTGSAVSLEPVQLTVTDGPVIMGSAEVKVADKIKLAKAEMIMDFRDKYFTVSIDQDLEPIEGVASAKTKGLLYIKWEPGDTYLFMGVNMTVNMLNFAKSTGTYVLGVNIKNPKNHSNALIKDYFAKLDDAIYGTNTNSSFSGLYVHLNHHIGVPKSRAKGIDLYIVSGRAWFHTAADVMLILNFAENDYRFGLSGTVSVGAEGCIVFDLCLGAGFESCFAFAGGYTTSQGWFLNGSAAGRFNASIGCSANCNSVGTFAMVPCGGKICLDAHAAFNISTHTNTTFDVSIGKGGQGNLCN